MAITATLTNANGSLQLPLVEIPLEEEILDTAVDIVTLDNSMYTDFINQKRLWNFPYDSMKEDDYNDVRAFFNYQFTSYQYPTISIPHYSIDNVYVRMYLNSKEIYNNCGDIQNIELSFRETDQLPEVS